MISKILQSFSRSLEHFFLTVGQNNFGNKIPFLSGNEDLSLLYFWVTPNTELENCAVEQVKSKVALTCS